MSINNYAKISAQYASLDNSGTAFLAFKTIPELLKKHAKGKKALDYGCGSGSSTAFLKEIGLDVEGVDISANMIHEAKQLNHEICFQLVKSARLPYTDNHFDIAFSSFVLFEISTKFKLKQVFNEIYRVLKKDGLFIAVTGSEELYSHNWLSLNVDFAQNYHLKSGDIAKVLLKDANLVVYDYYWTNEDYLEVIHASNFKIINTLFPLGEEQDGYLWQDEKYFPPYVIYVLAK